jgi:hypothetical protein
MQRQFRLDFSSISQIARDPPQKDEYLAPIQAMGLALVIVEWSG